jgi:hypothetical protein
VDLLQPEAVGQPEEHPHIHGIAQAVANQAQGKCAPGLVNFFVFELAEGHVFFSLKMRRFGENPL